MKPTQNNHPSNATEPNATEPPWYRQFWPWFIIALPASVVVASFYTLWLAISNPDPIIVKDSEYRKLRGELKAQTLNKESTQDNIDEAGSGAGPE